MNREKSFQITLVLLILLIFVPHIFSGKYTVANWFTTDDAFYYFKVAENFVHGKGITFDGINRTNGFHPLWMILIAPVFYFSQIDPFLPLRLVILIQGLLAVGMVLIFFRMAKNFVSQSVAFVMAAVWVLLPEILQITSNGTEAALNAFFLTILWSSVIRFSTINKQQREAVGNVLWLSFWAILLVFARLDNVYLVFAVGIWILFVFIRRSHRAGQPVTLRRFIRIGLFYYGPVALMIGLYMLINFLVFDTYLPVSGQIKGWWGTLDTTAYGQPVSSLRNYVGDFFSPNKSIGPWSLLTAKVNSLSNSLVTSRGRNSFSVGIYFELLLAGLIGFLVAEKKSYFRKSLGKAAIPALLAGTLLHISHYKVLGYVAQRSWYWISETFVLILLGSILLQATLDFLVEWKTSAEKSFRIIILAVILVSLIIIPHMRKIDATLNQKTVVEHYYLQKTHWLEERTEAGALIGMTGAGSTGYFIQNRSIFNLDGLINSKEYFVLLQSNQAGDYLDSIGLDYILANQRIILESDPYQKNFIFLNMMDEMGKFENKLILWKLSECLSCNP